MTSAILSLNGSRNCCTCKLHVLSAGVLTYTFIYSSSSITYLIILLLEAFTHSLSIFCIIPPDIDCCSLHLITVSYLNMCSVELPPGGVLAMNNVMHLLLLCPTLPDWWWILKGAWSQQHALWEEHLPFMEDFYSTFTHVDCHCRRELDNCPVQIPYYVPPSTNLGGWGITVIVSYFSNASAMLSSKLLMEALDNAWSGSW